LGDNKAERVIFDAYTTRYRTSLDIPALIPQVYLHYDPQGQRLRHATAAGAPLERQRMDFLLLFSDKRRVVIEVDGKQHYADGEKASPHLYARMVAEDRRLKLAGYEAFRFGGAELFDTDSQQMVEEFFDQLADRMKN
jgi:very-short-patch-repair endonuclease